MSSHQRRPKPANSETRVNFIFTVVIPLERHHLCLVDGFVFQGGAFRSSSGGIEGGQVGADDGDFTGGERREVVDEEVADNHGRERDRRVPGEA